MKTNTKKPIKSQRLTVYSLATETGFDQRTIRKRLVDAGLYPPDKHPRAAVLKAIRPTARDRDEPALERRRLRAQCEKLEHALAVERADYIKTDTVCALLTELGTNVVATLRQKLENEYPIAAAGLEPAQLHVLGKRFLDDTCERMRKHVESWKSAEIRKPEAGH